MTSRISSGLLALTLACLTHSATADIESTGSFAANVRYFPQERLDPLQQESYLSVNLEHTFQYERGDNQFTLTPYFRYEKYDNARRLSDLREAFWLHEGENFESRVGVSTVFWGVTESRHLVDVINQVDLIESLDGEVKLGQPMINVLFYNDWGDVDVYVLPYFRNRAFSERAGRPRLGLSVDWENPIYESSQEENHVDFALRWSHSLGDIDLALSHFSGTVREPELVPSITASGLTLVPLYAQVQQSGLEFQYSKGDWLWKLETVRQTGRGTFTAAVGGFEYNFVQVWGTVDLGLILEHSVDARNERATNPYQNDTFIGTRLAFNDAQSSEILMGLFVDNDDGSRIFSLEATTRLTDSMQLSIDVVSFSNASPSDLLLYPLRNDDFIELELSFFY